jgi:flagella basal body P-ring formation protein FlgA
LTVGLVAAADGNFEVPNDSSGAEDLTGAVLTRAVQRGHPFRAADITNQQVVAARDIPAGAVVEPGAVSLAWSQKQIGGSRRLADVLGHRTRRAIRSGDVVVDGAIAVSDSASQVIVQSASDLAAFHVIEPSDIGTANTPRVSGSFDDVNKVLGRYLLRRVAAGTTLTEDQLSDPGDAGRKQLLRLSVAAGGLGSGVQHGSVVSLLLSPRDRTSAGPPAVVLKDVLVAEAATRADGSGTIAIEVGPHELAVALPLLGASDILVLEPG